MNTDKLVIKAFHINKVFFNEKISLELKNLAIKNRDYYIEILKKTEHFNRYIKNINISIIDPKDKNIEVNSIMDFIPISTKVLGTLGNGITHTLTGVNVMLTGCDEIKNQICEFGKSNGILKDVVKFGMAGTPKETDYTIHIDIIVYINLHVNRECIDVCHEFCDLITNDIRLILKKKNGNEATERHDFIEKSNPNGKKIVILKQVAGQGAMYDTRLFSKEPSGFIGGYSIIDFMNMPIFISKNEYRDGAVRAMH